MIKSQNIQGPGMLLATFMAVCVHLQATKTFLIYIQIHKTVIINLK